MDAPFAESANAISTTSLELPTLSFCSRVSNRYPSVAFHPTADPADRWPPRAQPPVKSPVPNRSLLCACTQLSARGFPAGGPQTLRQTIHRRLHQRDILAQFLTFAGDIQRGKYSRSER